MIKKLFIIFLCLIVFQNGYSQKAVYLLPTTSHSAITNPTFFYTLPKTAFKVDVVITKTSNFQGLYADFAEKLLGITDFCKENAVSYKLKKITVTPFTVPDEKLQFVAELSQTQIQNNFLQSLYAKNTLPVFQVASKLEQPDTDILPDFFKNYADVVLQQSYETYTETKIIDGIVTQVPITQTKVTTKTLAQQAQEAAHFIEKIRDDRYAILSFSQEIALTKDAFEYLLNQLDELEKKYLELFTGITVFEDMYETLVIYPTGESSLLHICSVIPNSGFSTAQSKTHAYNYYLKYTPQHVTDLQADFNASLASNSKYKKNSGYSIRKAIPAFVSLVNNDIEEMLGMFPIYQFGLVETLPANADSFDILKWVYLY